jgi:hypothetical protein
MHELRARCGACGSLAAPHALEDCAGMLLCERCAELADAEQHEESCGCEACGQLSAKYEREAREREAATCGGLSGWGREALGWTE